MAVTSAQGFQIANEQSFQHRVQFFLTKAAVAVMAEANTTPGHAARLTYAGKVLDGIAAILPVAVAAVTNSTIQSEANIGTPADGGYAISDGDLEFTVNSLFSALAGVGT